MSYEPFAITWSGAAPPTRLPLEFRGRSSADRAFSANESLVALFDDNVLLGSGTLVVLPDGTVGILTARHVVVDLWVTGAFHCLLPSAGWTTVEPMSIRVHPRRDTAIVRVASGPESAIPWEAWKPTSPPTLSGDVLAVGLPGEWEGRVDASQRRIEHLRGLAAWCQADAGESTAGRKEIILPTSVELPKRFGGMSGGPVFAPDGRLVGVVTHETLHEPRRLIASPISESDHLVTPYTPPRDTPDDLRREVACLVFPIRYRDPNWYPQRPFHVVGLFEHFESQSNSDFRVSRLLALGCASAPQSNRFVLNTESIFHPVIGDLKDQIRECRIELDLMLNTPSMEVLPEGPEPSDATLALMHAMVDRLAPGRSRTVFRSSGGND